MTRPTFLLAGGLLCGAALLGCHPNPPKCPEQCPPGTACTVPAQGCVPIPPPPVEPKYVDMLLRKCSPTDSRLCANGQPVKFRGTIGCCMAWPGLRWPLVGRDFVDSMRQIGDANFFHGRPGPFLSRDEPDTLSASGPTIARLALEKPLVAQVGGAYQEVNGIADLTRWNEAFWTFLDSDVDYVGSTHSWYQIDVDDGWRLKSGCPYSAWRATNNVQHEDHCALVVGDPVVDAYLQKLVATVGRYGNVYWQISNESGQIVGKTPQLIAWEKWIRDRIRYWEEQVGFGLVHMIGTNSVMSEIESAPWIDIVTWHNTVPTEPQYGKPTDNNETNPQNSADQLLWRYCKALKGGAYFWTWRAELSDAEFTRALQLVKAASADNCANVDTSDCPYAVQPTQRIRCKPFGTHGTCDGKPCPAYDCTPIKAGGDPVWPEGDGELRAACEQKSMGGMMSFSMPAPLRIDHLIHAGYGFAVGGSGTATVSCTIPRPPAGFRGCVNISDGPLTITRQ